MARQTINIGLCWILISSLCAIASVHAATDGSAPVLPPADGSPDDVMQQVIEHSRRLERRVVGLGRVRLAYPQGIGGSVGAIVFRQPEDYDCTTVCDFRGLLYQAEPGLNGLQLSVGYGLVIGEKKHNDFFLSDVYVGFGIKGALLRTWGDAALDPTDQTFVGAEGSFTLTRVNFSLGLFRNLSGEPGDDRWLVTGGVGWGF